MGLRGPAPKPTWLKKLDGNPGKRAIPKNEMVPSKLVPWLEPPSYFDDVRRACWSRVCKELAAVNALSPGDRFPLERYIEFLVKWQELRDYLQHHCKGMYSFPVKNPKTGVSYSVKPIPEVKIFIEFSQHLLRIEQNFGLTPAARTRILLDNSPEGSEDDDDFSDLDA